MGELLIRQASLIYAKGIAKVHVSTWQSTYSGMIPDSYLQSLNVEQGAKNWGKNLEASVTGNRTLGAEIDEVIVGFIGVGLSRESDESGLGEVYAIYVDPSNQSHGIGSNLRQEGIQFLKGEELRGAVPWVLDQNIRTRNWYEPHGWEPNGKSKIEKCADFELVETQYFIDF